ncbi:MAG: hypothetical protein KDI55_18130 [Anaerolineae bacterium]|nr:hypothetical protein [Anaerolineae bacterium]MCB0255639.1 hypothetical protein [Anaerolineae bacterium]
MKTLCLLTVCLLLCSACGHRDDPKIWAADVVKIESIFPALEEKGVRVFRNNDWCKAFEYTKGSYTNEFDDNCIYLLNAKPRPFDPAATQSFLEVSEVLQATDIGITIIKAKYNSSGELIFGEFDFGSGFSRRYYVYSPGYTLPTDIPDELVHTPINLDWYHIWMDWN